MSYGLYNKLREWQHIQPSVEFQALFEMIKLLEDQQLTDRALIDNLYDEIAALKKHSPTQKENNNG